jgi:hypothetical protein
MRSEPIDVPLLIGANSNEASVILAMGVPPATALTYLGSDQAAGRKAYGAGLPETELARQVFPKGVRPRQTPIVFLHALCYQIDTSTIMWRDCNIPEVAWTE